MGIWGLNLGHPRKAIDIAQLSGGLLGQQAGDKEFFTSPVKEGRGGGGG